MRREGNFTRSERREAGLGMRKRIFAPKKTLRGGGGFLVLFY